MDAGKKAILNPHVSRPTAEDLEPNPAVLVIRRTERRANPLVLQ